MKPPAFFSGHLLKNWLELIVLVMFFTGVVILVNYIAYRHNTRYDLTPEKRHSLSAHSLRILDTLTSDLSATVFYKPQERREFEDLIGLFARASNYFHYSFIDLEKNPATAQNMGIKTYGAGIVEYQGKKERVQSFTEENLIRAIISLTEKGEKTVRFVKGHGEKDISSSDAKNGYNRVNQALVSENYRVEDILLMQADKIPDDTRVLVISGPQKDFFQKELDMIDVYVKNGGSLLVLCDPFPLPEVESYLQGFNIQLAHDFIIDTRSKLLALDDLTPIVIPDKTHPVAQYMNDAVVFPVCRSVIPTPGKEVDVLAHSSPESWAEQDTQTVYDGKARFDKDQDMPGPVSVAVAARIEAGPEPGYVVVMGDSDFAANHYFDVLGNKDMFLNTINWLAEKKQLLSTRSKAAQTPVSFLFLTENEGRLVLWSSVFIEPAFILLIGILVVLWRRIRR